MKIFFANTFLFNVSMTEVINEVLPLSRSLTTLHVALCTCLLIRGNKNGFLCRQRMNESEKFYLIWNAVLNSDEIWV